MRIIEIRTPEDENGIQQFHQVARTVYQEDPVWVPQSEMMFMQRFKNHRFRTENGMVAVIGLENETPVARAVAIMAPGARDDSAARQGWISFFECLPAHPQAACAVLSRCEQILRQAGAKSILFPKVDSQLVGLLINGFELPQTILTNHNPAYYLGYVQSCGYQIKSKVLSLYFTREHAQQVDVTIPGYSTREFNREQLSEEITVFHELQKAIFSGHPDYLPRTLEQDRDMVHQFLPYLQDNLVIIAQDLDDKPVGLLVCLPDLYQALRGEKIDRVRMISIGVLPHLTHQGIGKLMGAHLMRNLLHHEDYIFAEGSLILAANAPPQNLAKRFNAKPGREFAVLEKRL